MSKTKISAKSTPASESPEEKSTIQTPEAKEPKKTVRILYLGTCPKLTTRGRGDLSYELGIDETTGDSYVRISANVSSGAFSNEWLDIGRIQTLLDLKTDQQKTFSAVAMESLFLRRSANNYGYLAAVLKAEGVITVLPGKPVMLSIGEWNTIHQKIQTLKDKGVSLTDHIAIAANLKAEKRAQLVANMRTSKTAKAENKPKESSEPEDESGEVDPEASDEKNAEA